MWRGGRAVEGTGLENQHTLTGIGGSNPPLSANCCNFDYVTGRSEVLNFVSPGGFEPPREILLRIPFAFMQMGFPLSPPVFLALLFTRLRSFELGRGLRNHEKFCVQNFGDFGEVTEWLKVLAC